MQTKLSVGTHFIATRPRCVKRWTKSKKKLNANIERKGRKRHNLDGCAWYSPLDNDYDASTLANWTICLVCVRVCLESYKQIHKHTIQSKMIFRIIVSYTVLQLALMAGQLEQIRIRLQTGTAFCRINPLFWSVNSFWPSLSLSFRFYSFFLLCFLRVHHRWVESSTYHHEWYEKYVIDMWVNHNHFILK